jgi:NADH:ubiquinone oxidoreductase subunit 3 (subunit A)
MRLCDFFHKVFTQRFSTQEGAAMLLWGTATPTMQTPAGVEPAFDLATYYPIFIYFLCCILVPVGGIVASHIINPKKKTSVKLMPYESGMDPIGPAHHKFDVKFYLIAILFLVFDVELLFLYPWAVIAYRSSDLAWRATFGRVVFFEILIFLATLAVAYVYAWRKGVFKWH